MALGWVGLFVGILAAGAVALWFVTGTTQKNIARATVAHAFLDVAASALAEVNAKIRTACMENTPYDGVAYAQQLTVSYPLVPATHQPHMTRKLLGELYPDITIGPVTVRSLARTNPGQSDPVVGMLEMQVTVEGKVGGWTMGREVTQRVVFLVPYSAQAVSGPLGSYRSPHWGEPSVVPYAEAQEVRNL